MLREYSDFTKRMIEKYPKLLTPPPDTPYNDWGLEHPRGWDRLVEDFFDEIEPLCRPFYDTDKSFQLAQCKSKFAGLRIYIERSPPGLNLRDIVTKYEQRAAKTSEASGREGAVTFDLNGWLCRGCPDEIPQGGVVVKDE